MVKKIIIVLAVISVYVIGCFYSFKNNKEDINQTYLKNVIFQTEDSMLVPVSLNFYNEMDIEQEILNRIDIMKSNHFIKEGLYPVFSENLEVHHIDLHNQVLSIDFNDELFVNGKSIDILETLSYLFHDYNEIKEVNVMVNGEKIDKVPNSFYSIENINKNLGLNNFEETNEYLHHTYPVMIYTAKEINNHTYFIPITTRISELIDLTEQINHILKFINPNIKCIKSSLNNNELNISLDSNILIEDGMIDKNLYKQFLFTFLSMKEIKKVNIEINNETIMNEDVSSLQINYLKI